MKKIALRSSSNLENALDHNLKPYWYVVLHDEVSAELSDRNPWNQDEAVITQTLYLADDCVITLRPARHSLEEGQTPNYEKDHYFVEISNQDRSTVFTSFSVYTWEDANTMAFYFKGLSFTAATRVWKVKKL
jgi:hypothetical protein